MSVTSVCRRVLVALIVVFCVRIAVHFVQFQWSLSGGWVSHELVEHPVYSAGMRKMAIVVPMYAGDLEEAVVALSAWPNTCSTQSLQYMELVVYFAGGENEEKWSDDVLLAVEETGGRCFLRTRAVFAHLEEKVRLSEMKVPAQNRFGKNPCDLKDERHREVNMSLGSLSSSAKA